MKIAQGWEPSPLKERMVEWFKERCRRFARLFWPRCTASDHVMFMQWGTNYYRCKCGMVAYKSDGRWNILHPK